MSHFGTETSSGGLFAPVEWMGCGIIRHRMVMDFAQELKSRIDIVSVIGERVRLKKAGANRYSGLCPFHTEKTGSFSVSVTSQRYYCFGCQAKGDVIGFVMEIEGIPFYEALKEL